MSARTRRQAPELQGAGASSSPTPDPHGAGINWDLAHQRLRDDHEKWGRLQFACLFAWTTPRDLFEMRTCPECGTTIHKVVDTARAAQLAAQQSELVARTVSILSRGVVAPCG